MDIVEARRIFARLQSMQTDLWALAGELEHETAKAIDLSADLEDTTFDHWFATAEHS